MLDDDFTQAVLSASVQLFREFKQYENTVDTQKGITVV